jgi:2-oxoisovalerate ferredoxin oxidoreductase delta subunit
MSDIRKKNKKNFILKIKKDECKGCGRCIYSCPVAAIVQTKSVNAMGYLYVEYVEGCIGCGNCFYACPEPGAVTVVEIIEEGDNA